MKSLVQYLNESENKYWLYFFVRELSSAKWDGPFDNSYHMESDGWDKNKYLIFRTDKNIWDSKSNIHDKIVKSWNKKYPDDNVKYSDLDPLFSDHGVYETEMKKIDRGLKKEKISVNDITDFYKSYKGDSLDIVKNICDKFSL